MKQRRVCASSDETSGNGIGRGDADESLPPTCASEPVASRFRASSPFARWADEERKDAFVRVRLRRLLLAGEAESPSDDDDDADEKVNAGRRPNDADRDAEPITAPSSPQRSDDDDDDNNGGGGCDQELMYDMLCRDANPTLYGLALHSKRARRSSDAASVVVAAAAASEYRVIVEALLHSARSPTLAALGRHLAARAAARHRRLEAESRSPTLLAALPTACLQLAVAYLRNPWRLAAVCRRWHTLVRSGPLHLSHQLAHALRRFDTTDASSFEPDRAEQDGSGGDGDSDDGDGDSDDCARAATEKMQADRVTRTIAARTIVTRFRARTMRAFLPAPEFRSVDAVARLLAGLSRLRRLTAAFRVDNARSTDPTAPLDALDTLPHLDTLRLTLVHAYVEPGEFRMHVPRLPSLTRLECRTRGVDARNRRSTPVTLATLHIRCEALRVLRLQARSEASIAHEALPRIDRWEQAQALEELSLDFGRASDYSGRRYEQLFWTQCVDLDGSLYAHESERGFAGVLQLPPNADPETRRPPTRFARSMQRLRRLEIDGHFTVPPHLAALDAVRIRTHAHRQDAAWSTLVSLRSIACRVDPMADAVKLARYAPPSVTHVDLDARTLRRTTAAEFAAVRELAARLKAAGGALTWNGGAAVCPEFRVTDDVQQLRVRGSDDDDEFPNADDDEFSDDGEDAGRGPPESLCR